MNGFTTATTVLTNLEHYIFDLVSPEEAARDMGYPLQQATALWRNAVDLKTGYPNGLLTVLSGGQAIKRGAWEASFGDAMRAVVPQPWEQAVVPIQTVVPVYVPAKQQTYFAPY